MINKLLKTQEDIPKDIAIRLEDVSKTFYIADDKKFELKALFAAAFNQGKSKKFKAVNNINLDVKKGEVVGIIGKNGSGKSTLLKIIANIYNPDKGGKVFVDGKIVPFLELGVGFNTQLSGRENIYLNGTILGLTRAQIDEKFDEIVEYSGLERFIDTPVKNYSSGMKVRLGFSIAIQVDAGIFIIDEILAVGDAEFRQKSGDKIKEFIEGDKTVIIVSHGLENIRQYCNRVLWLEDGKEKFIGDTDVAIELYNEKIIEKESNKIDLNDELASTGSKEIIPTDIQVEVAKDRKKIDIHIDIENKKGIEDYELTVAVRKDTDDLISLIRTTLAKDLKLTSDTKHVHIELADANLLYGKHYLDISIKKGEEGESRTFYWKKHAAVFNLPRELYLYQNEGVVELKHNWKLS